MCAHASVPRAWRTAARSVTRDRPLPLCTRSSMICRVGAVLGAVPLLLRAALAFVISACVQATTAAARGAI